MKFSIKFRSIFLAALLAVGTPSVAQVGLGSKDPREMGSPERPKRKAPAPVTLPRTRQKAAPFQVVINPPVRPNYLEEMLIQVRLVPRPGSAEASAAVQNKRTILFVDGKMIGERNVTNDATFMVPTQQASQLNLTPGNHRIEAQVFHEGDIFKGAETLEVRKGFVEFKEGTSPHIYFGHTGSKYMTCHHEGDVLDISVKVVNAANGITPVMNSPIEYKIAGGITACSGKTDYNGLFNCSFPLSRDHFPAVDFWDEPRHSQFVQDLHHFNLPENELYRRKFDSDVYRTLCICAKGRTFNRQKSKCE